MNEPMKCKCGAKARIRTKGEYAWIECSNKKCDMRSGYIHFVDDGDSVVKNVAIDHAITLWNRMVVKDG